MMSFSDNNQANVIEAHNTSIRNIDDFLNIDNPYINKWCQIYPTETQLKPANNFYT